MFWLHIEKPEIWWFSLFFFSLLAIENLSNSLFFLNFKFQIFLFGKISPEKQLTHSYGWLDEKGDRTQQHPLNLIHFLHFVHSFSQLRSFIFSALLIHLLNSFIQTEI
jgi:hypothetical protein